MGAVKYDYNDRPFLRGESVQWTRGLIKQLVIYVEEMKNFQTKIINKNGLLMIVPSFELSHISERGDS